MPFRRSLVLRASIAAAVVLGSSAAAAEESAPPKPVPRGSGIHVNVDLLAGLVFRLGKFDSIASRGGGMAGVNALIGHKPWYSAGLGYERTFFGREQTDTRMATFSQVSRTLDTLWFLGRVYPYMTDAVGIFVQVGLGPAWQGVRASTTNALGNAESEVLAPAMSCSGRSSAGLGIRVGGGAEFSLTNLISLTMGVGLDQLAITSKSINNCVAGSGAQTSLTARAGLVITPGRASSPPAQPPPPTPLAPPASPDRDEDGIPNAADACPDVKGVPNADPRRHGCPAPSDRDQDNIFDEQDACPTEAGFPNADPKKHGCPPPKDGDSDGVPDEQDACPTIKGEPSPDPKINGCPGDTDGDSIRDDQDACPKVKGIPNAEDPTKHGCPLVQVTEKEIVINEQVQFEVDKSIIRPASDPLLDQVAAMIKAHPEIVKIEVQGHTDNSGNPELNRILSQNRATSVKKALVRRGIADHRLDPKGYGQAQPIADNATEAGKAKNRRVQFQIVQKKDPAALVHDGGSAPKPPGSDAAPKPEAPKPVAPPKK